ncbi:MAG: B12-binding domain-containing radical SAM protein [Anaerolineae bacterium]
MKHRLIALVNPPAPSGFTANRDGAGGLGACTPGKGGFRYPPLALATAASLLRREGYGVRVVDAPGEGLTSEETLTRVPAEAEVWVVLASWATARADEAFLRLLRTARPGCKVLLLTSALDVWESQRVTALADAWLLGDGDLCIPQAVAAVREGMRGLLTPQALGLSGYAEDGRRRELAGLPAPAWDLLPWEQAPFLTALTSRGCPDGCAYCPYVVGQGRVFRPRPTPEVVEELASVARMFRPRRVILRDPVFARDGNRAAEMAEGLIRAGVRLNWECESRPEHFADEALLRLLRRAGCSSIKVGLESGDLALLVALGRAAPMEAGAYLETARRVIEMCQRVGLPCRPFVMVGLPGQTLESVRKTAEFLATARPPHLHVRRFVPYPGTRLWKERDRLAERAEVEQQEALLRAVPLSPRRRPSLWRRLAARLKKGQ